MLSLCVREGEEGGEEGAEMISRTAEAAVPDSQPVAIAYIKSIAHGYGAYTWPRCGTVHDVHLSTAAAHIPLDSLLT